MVEVTKEEFFAFLKSDNRDIMPTTELPYKTLWRDQRTREIVGESTPGWKNPRDAIAYKLARGNNER